MTVDGNTFVGEGKNKKIAKARAAQQALKELFGMEFQTPEGKLLFLSIFHLTSHHIPNSHVIQSIVLKLQ